jgi:hypothetical protein
MHVDRDIIERVQAQPNADTQVGSEGVKARTPVGFFDLDTGLAIWD